MGEVLVFAPSESHDPDTAFPGFRCSPLLLPNVHEPGTPFMGIPGSISLNWLFGHPVGGSWGESAGGEEHAEAVVLAVAIAAGEAAVELDDPVESPMYVKQPPQV
jgi:hypothetical protein